MGRIWSGVTERITGDSIPALTDIYGIPVFVGVGDSPAGELQSFDRYSDIRSRIGYGPLTRQIEDFFASAGQDAKCFAWPLAADTASTVGSWTKTGTSTGTVGSTGTPKDAFDLLVEIVTGGTDTAATFRFSYDGGENWSETQTCAATVVQSAATGLTLTFEGTSDCFVAGDTFAASSSAPAATNAHVTEAMTAILAAGYRSKFEYFVIVGAADSAAQAAIATILASEFSAHNPIFGLCQAAKINSATKSADVTALVSAAGSTQTTAGANCRFLAVVAGQCMMSSAAGEYLSRSPLGSVAGILQKGKVSDSIGMIKDNFGLIQSAVALDPSSLTAADITTLNNCGYTVCRTYEGYPGIFPNNGNLISAPGDPFDDIEKIRVTGKMIRLCRIAALRCLHLDADSSANYAFGGVSGLAYLREELRRAVDPMRVNGELYSFEPHVISTPNDVYLSKNVNVRIDFTTNPKMKTISLTFDLVSPDEFARRQSVTAAR